jgi:tRNA 5-methylaminomethyl-2-thiouridine biosynthesis bifunctional protein
VTGRLPSPRLVLPADGPPRSERFGDIYFSDSDGLAETRHVFLRGCGFPDGFAGRRRVTIAETGFGTGLNFLAAWRDLPPETGLDFVSVELCPLSQSEMRALPDPWPELSELRRLLAASWPVPHPGWRRLVFEGGRVTLTLGFGEAAERFAEMDAAADAWFLDGFSPARNPDMWRDEVLDEISRLSRPGTRLASFTAAGSVRRGLAARGFAMEKRPGHGHKRDMLTGVFTGEPPPPRAASWYPFPAAPGGSALVLGGGIAGCAMAGALFRRGLEVTVLEAEELAAGASGNERGIVMPMLTAAASPAGDFHEEAFRFASAEYGDLMNPCGVLQLIATPGERDRAAKLVERGRMPEGGLTLLDPGQASAAAGVALPCDALHYPAAGWIDPRAACRKLAEGARILTGRRAAGLERTGGGWAVRDGEGRIIAESDILILAEGAGLTVREQAGFLPLSLRRGQVTRAAATPASRGLRCVLTHRGYLMPACAGGTHWLGATYDPGGAPDASPEDDARNLFELEQALPGLGLVVDGPGRAGLRLVTPDRMPVAGPAVVPESYPALYGDWAIGERRRRWPEAPCREGLWLLGGLGSRGLTTAPLLAEILASAIAGQPPPVSRAVREALHPARFLMRGLKTGESFRPAGG